MSATTDTATEARTVTALVLDRGRAVPRQVAMRVLESGIWREYGWADVTRTVARVAGLLESMGVTPGSTVAVACGSRAEWSLSIWAVNALGARAVAVTTQADEATLTELLDQSPVAWIVEGAEPIARLDLMGRAPDRDTVLTIDEVDGDNPPRWTWSTDVVEADPADDDTRLNRLAEAVAAVDPATEALTVPEESGQALTHAEVFAAGRSQHLGMHEGDEYLAFLPPTWTGEAVMLLAAHPIAAAVVNWGSRGAATLGEFRAVQPTVIHAPSEWWDSVAGRVRMVAAEPAPLAKGAMRALIEGRGGVGVGLARRILTRRLGLSRIREARSLGPVAAPTAAVLAGLGIELGEDLARPTSLGDSTAEGAGGAAADPGETPRNDDLEGAS